MCDNLNLGHRGRLRERFVKSSVASFYDYEILEMFLFKTFTRKDTRLLSKKMLQKFGSLEAVINAPPEELELIDGVGKRVVEDILFLKNVLDHILNSKVEKQEYVLSSSLSVINYCDASLLAAELAAEMQQNETHITASLDHEAEASKQQKNYTKLSKRNKMGEEVISFGSGFGITGGFSTRDLSSGKLKTMKKNEKKKTIMTTVHDHHSFIPQHNNKNSDDCDHVHVSNKKLRRKSRNDQRNDQNKSNNDKIAKEDTINDSIDLFKNTSNDINQSHDIVISKEEAIKILKKFTNPNAEPDLESITKTLENLGKASHKASTISITEQFGKNTNNNDDAAAVVTNSENSNFLQVPPNHYIANNIDTTAFITTTNNLQKLTLYKYSDNNDNNDNNENIAIVRQSTNVENVKTNNDILSQDLFLKTKITDSAKLKILFLNRKNILIADESFIYHPSKEIKLQTQDVVKSALYHSASAVIMVFVKNNSNKPTKYEIKISSSIFDALTVINICFHDIMIVTNSSYYSFRSHNLL